MCLRFFVSYGEQAQVISNETLLGRGRIAEVFAWGNDQVLKLSYLGQSLDWIEEEARISRLVYETGVATPAVGDIIEVDGRHGIIYGRVHGPSMLTEMSSKPWKLVPSAKMLAKPHASMHEKTVNNLPSQRQILRRSIRSVPVLTDQKKMPSSTCWTVCLTIRYYVMTIFIPTMWLCQRTARRNLHTGNSPWLSRA